MKRLIVLFFTFGVLFFAISPQFAKAQDEGNVGIGVIAGQPTGLSAKIKMGQHNALHAGFAWAFSPTRSRMHIHLDYTRYNFDVLEAQVGALAFYYGIGGRLLTNDNNLGVRFPLGLNYEFEDNPLEIFVEVVPLINIAPNTDLTGNSGAGLRIYL